MLSQTIICSLIFFSFFMLAVALAATYRISYDNALNRVFNIVDAINVLFIISLMAFMADMLALLFYAPDILFENIYLVIATLIIYIVMFVIKRGLTAAVCSEALGEKTLKLLIAGCILALLLLALFYRMLP